MTLNTVTPPMRDAGIAIPLGFSGGSVLSSGGGISTIMPIARTRRRSVARPYAKVGYAGERPVHAHRQAST